MRAVPVLSCTGDGGPLLHTHARPCLVYSRPKCSLPRYTRRGRWFLSLGPFLWLFPMLAVIEAQCIKWVPLYPWNQLRPWHAEWGEWLDWGDHFYEEPSGVQPGTDPHLQGVTPWGGRLSPHTACPPGETLRELCQGGRAEWWATRRVVVHPPIPYVTCIYQWKNLPVSPHWSKLSYASWSNCLPCICPNSPPAFMCWSLNNGVGACCRSCSSVCW